MFAPSAGIPDARAFHLRARVQFWKKVAVSRPPLKISSRFAKYNKVVRVISRKALRQASLLYPDVEEWLAGWFQIAKTANWASIQDVRFVYAHADQVGDCTVFNVKGNRYRLIVRFRFKYQRVYVLNFLTHAEYSKGRWRNECD